MRNWGMMNHGDRYPTEEYEAYAPKGQSCSDEETRKQLAAWTAYTEAQAHKYRRRLLRAWWRDVFKAFCWAVVIAAIIVATIFAAAFWARLAQADDLKWAEDLPVHGTCWACMHGCTRKQNIANCGLDPGPTTQDQADCWLFETRYAKPCVSYQWAPRRNYECQTTRVPIERVCVPR